MHALPLGLEYDVAAVAAVELVDNFATFLASIAVVRSFCSPPKIPLISLVRTLNTHLISTLASCISSSLNASRTRQLHPTAPLQPAPSCSILMKGVLMREGRCLDGTHSVATLLLCGTRGLRRRTGWRRCSRTTPSFSVSSLILDFGGSKLMWERADMPSASLLLEHGADGSWGGQL